MNNHQTIRRRIQKLEEDDRLNTPEPAKGKKVYPSDLQQKIAFFEKRISEGELTEKEKEEIILLHRRMEQEGRVIP